MAFSLIAQEWVTDVTLFVVEEYHLDHDHTLEGINKLQIFYYPTYNIYLKAHNIREFFNYSYTPTPNSNSEILNSLREDLKSYFEIANDYQLIQILSLQQYQEGRWTCHLFGAVLSASIGSFEFGYNIGCINMPADLIKEWFAASYNKGLAIHEKRMTADVMETEWSIAVSIFAIGGIAGGFSCGYFADKLGRKTALLMNNVVALVATGFFVFAKLFDVPAILQLSTLMLCPESPKYTIKVGDNHFQAQQDLIKLRGHTNVQDELKLISNEAKSAKTEEGSFASLFGSYQCWPLALSIFLIVAQQLSGINYRENLKEINFLFSL
uniref:Major facilitator superfamily (MFS) profile domain-containing protein n=1 Tax=Meloidogyne javanica TaxID=6303 RepID=A0A915M1B6_MELJA